MGRVLIVGGGAREHAMANALAREADVFCAPGNAGTALVAKNFPMATSDVRELVELAKSIGTDLVVVGPEVPLVLGLTDALQAAGLAVFGPSRAASALEGSKVFMKEFLRRHRIPTAEFRVFNDADEASRYVEAAGRALVVKTDGLAAGKGVTVASNVEEALAAIDRAMTKGEFGESGRRLVIEERLSGQEASVHFLCDGETFVPLVAAQDHKRILDGDRGPNTGGMGAYAPAPIASERVVARIAEEVVVPTLRGMNEEGAPFRGVLFVGLMIDGDDIRVLEFNVRFGDPESSVLFPLYRWSWLSVLTKGATGQLATLSPSERGARAGASLAVVLAAAGYPGTVRTGDVIEGVRRDPPPGVYVHHAGTSRDQAGRLLTAGGRVLCVGATAESLEIARDLAYAEVARIRFEGRHYRTDIGHHALKGSGI